MRRLVEGPIVFTFAPKTGSACPPNAKLPSIQNATHVGFEPTVSDAAQYMKVRFISKIGSFRLKFCARADQSATL